MTGRSVRATCGLLLVLLLGAIYLGLSFHPRLRFANPAPNIPVARGAPHVYHCYYNHLYLGVAASDVLVLGSSRTNRALDKVKVMRDALRVGKQPPALFVYHTPWTNPELAYFFLRTHLANNPPPKVLLVELTPIMRLPEPVQYVHPLLVDLAPFYLYLDVLKSWDFVTSPVFAASHFLRLLIRHVDFSLSRVLVRDYRVLADRRDDCVATLSARDRASAEPFAGGYDALLRSEMEAVMPPFAPEAIGLEQSVLQTYSGNRAMLKQVEKSAAERDRARGWASGPSAERSLDYYSRIIAMAREHDIAIAFYVMPDLLATEETIRQSLAMSSVLGVPVYALPYDDIRVSYHHYSDGVHVTKPFRQVYSTWFASLIERVGGG